MFCPSCGKEIPEQSVFCPKCGQYINRNPAEGTASAAPPAVDQSPQAPAASANREAAGTTYKKTSTFGSNSLYRRIIMGIAAVMILAIVLVVSGITRSSEKPAAGASGSADAKANGDKTVDTVKSQEDQAKAKLDEADSAFRAGDYDTALRLYRDIDTDYAKARVHAIECIPVADAVAKEWLEATDNVANEVLLAAFGLDFTFDTEYDPQTYTFYTKMYYPSLYTDLATSFGTSRETIEEGVTSSSHEKTAYEMFCKRGYEDITCISNMYDSDGGLLASFPYNKEIQEADTIRAQQEEEAAAAKAALAVTEQERIRNEFIAGLNSNDEFWSAIDKNLEEFDSRNKLEQVTDQYWRDHKDRWKYDSLSSFKIIEMEYGEPYVLDSERESKKSSYVGEMTAFDYGPVIIHLPCTAEVSAVMFYGSDTEVIFNVELELVFETNPLILRSPYRLKQDAVTVISMEEDEAYTPAIENPLDVPADNPPNLPVNLSEPFGYYEKADGMGGFSIEYISDDDSVMIEYYSEGQPGYYGGQWFEADFHMSCDYIDFSSDNVLDFIDSDGNSVIRFDAYKSYITITASAPLYGVTVDRMNGNYYCKVQSSILQ